MASTRKGDEHDFHDIDVQTGFEACFSSFNDPSTRNFAVEFDAEHASCAVDLGKEDVSSILDSSTDASRPCRWINLWGWDEGHRSIVELLAERYDVSPRLTHLLCPQRLGQPSSDRTRSMEKHHGNHQIPDLAPQAIDASDLEKAAYSESDSELRHLSHDHFSTVGDVVNEFWHFCSVDWGRRYLYVGFNALFAVPSQEQQAESDKPAGRRIWSSILLCDDGTVVSVFEQPGRHETDYAAAISKIRRNQLNIFRHLSKLPLPSTAQNALMHVTIRAIHNGLSSSNAPYGYSREAASLMLYYLFDDWITTYALIARREHPYRDKLESLRERMMEKAQVDLIRALHRVGRQLTVLKLIYQSYDIMLNHILQRQRNIRRALRAPSTGPQQAMNVDWQDGTPFDDVRPVLLDHNDDEGSTVYLATSAIVRLERLQDRIRLYALNEIEQCLEEKEQLVFMVCQSNITLSEV